LLGFGFTKNFSTQCLKRSADPTQGVGSPQPARITFSKLLNFTAPIVAHGSAFAGFSAVIHGENSVTIQFLSLNAHLPINLLLIRITQHRRRINFSFSQLFLILTTLNFIQNHGS